MLNVSVTGRSVVFCFRRDGLLSAVSAVLCSGRIGLLSVVSTGSSAVRRFPAGKMGVACRLAILVLLTACHQGGGALVFQSDFGLKDGAVSAMKGVAYGVSPELALFDLTHEIPAYNIWEAAYRLEQTAPYWPKGTVFVSVVDPGVGTERKSVVMLSRSGHYFVTPDNGTLTLVAQSLGIAAVREIDEAVNRRQQSGGSYTFHGRDVYAYTGARLAAGVISFEQVGRLLPDSVVKIPYQPASRKDQRLLGGIPILDIQYGNVWTNIPDSLVQAQGWKAGDSVQATIFRSGDTVWRGRVPFVHTFGEVPEGSPMAYLNSLMNFSLAINMGSFADSFGVRSGPEWRVELDKW